MTVTDIQVPRPPFYKTNSPLICVVFQAVLESSDG